MDMDVKLQWHSPDQAWAAVFMRDGEPWYLDGALVGMGLTPHEAVDDLVGIAHHLVVAGGNFLLQDGISPLDRKWLFNLFDRGNDVGDIQRRYEAMRDVGVDTK